MTHDYRRNYSRPADIVAYEVLNEKASCGSQADIQTGW